MVGISQIHGLSRGGAGEVVLPFYFLGEGERAIMGLFLAERRVHESRN